MIPFGALAPLFHRFGERIYGEEIKALLRLLVEHLPEGAHLADVGAGTCVLSHMTQRYRDDLTLTAIDPCEKMLYYCHDDIMTHRASAEAIPLGNATCDAVIVGEALHHFRDVDTALNEIDRILKPEGILFLYDFDPTRFKGRMIAFFEKLMGEPAHFFAPDEIAKRLEEIGFACEIKTASWRYVIEARKGEQA